MQSIAEINDIADVGNIKISEILETDGIRGIEIVTWEKPRVIKVHLRTREFLFLKNSFGLSTSYKKCKYSRGDYVQESADLPGNIRIIHVVELPSN